MNIGLVHCAETRNNYISRHNNGTIYSLQETKVPPFQVFNLLCCLFIHDLQLGNLFTLFLLNERFESQVDLKDIVPEMLTLHIQMICIYGRAIKLTLISCAWLTHSGNTCEYIIARVLRGKIDRSSLLYLKYHKNILFG